MSRKSRQKAVDCRRRARWLLAGAGAVLLCVGWLGTAMLLRLPSLEPIRREEAISVNDTLREATLLRRRTRRQPLRLKEVGLRLDFAGAGSLTIPYGWRDLAWESAVPDGWRLTHAAPREEHVSLPALPEGSRCFILTDPRDPAEILHLETEDGILIDFDRTMATMADIRHRTKIFALMILGAALAGSGALCVVYIRRIRKAPAIR